MFVSPFWGLGCWGGWQWALMDHKGSFVLSKKQSQ